MQATPRTITALFEQPQRYVVPIFQRHYVWTREEQWEPLWDDIAEKLSDRRAGRRKAPHFFGAVILDSVRKANIREFSRFLVIDGQQRLTTFQLLLAALRDFAREKGFVPVECAAERCLLNPDTGLMENPDEEKYKLWPTQVNRKAFCKIVNAGSYNAVRATFPFVRLPRKRKPEKRERLAEAYEFFFEQIRDQCTKCSSPEEETEFLRDLLGILKDDFTIVEITLGIEDNSQEIFNSLNARGKVLSQSDLLRSYIFMRAEKEAVDRDRLYNEYWSKFEKTEEQTEKDWWGEEIKRGNITSSRLDTLVRTLLSAKLGTPIDVRRVQATYSSWIETAAPYPTLEDELKEFCVYGNFYEQLHGKMSGPLKLFGQRMLTWDTSTVFPLAIFLAVEGGLSTGDLSECLSYLEGFIVRRAVYGLQTKEYNKFFIEVIARLRKSGVSYQALAEILCSGEGETRHFPNDVEFAEAWRSNPIYKRLKSNQITLMLRQLERAIRSERAEAVPVPDVSVEHIMPQNWHSHYPLAGEYIPALMNSDYSEWYVQRGSPEEKAQYQRLKSDINQRRMLIHTMGNLTAVTQRLNAAMQNSAFAEKKLHFRESVLALNRYFENLDEWNETTIQQRADKLFAYAKNIWRGP